MTLCEHIIYTRLISKILWAEHVIDRFCALWFGRPWTCDQTIFFLLVQDRPFYTLSIQGLLDRLFLFPLLGKCFLKSQFFLLVPDHLRATFRLHSMEEDVLLSSHSPHCRDVHVVKHQLGFLRLLNNFYRWIILTNLFLELLHRFALFNQLVEWLGLKSQPVLFRLLLLHTSFLHFLLPRDQRVLLGRLFKQFLRKGFLLHFEWLLTLESVSFCLFLVQFGRMFFDIHYSQI